MPSHFQRKSKQACSRRRGTSLFTHIRVSCGVNLCCFLCSRHLPLGKARHLVARAFAPPTTGCALLLTLRPALSLTCLLAREVLALAPARSCRALSCACCGSREGLRPPDAVAETPRATDAGVYIAKLTVSTQSDATRFRHSSRAIALQMARNEPQAAPTGGKQSHEPTLDASQPARA